MHPDLYNRRNSNCAETLLVVILLFLCLTACSSSKYSKDNFILPLEIVNSTIAKGIRAEGDLSLPVKPTHEFTSEDKEVVSHILFSNLTKVHHVRWDWYDPAGKLYYSTGDYQIRARKGMQIKKGSLYHQLKLKNSTAVNHPGTWMVKISLDNKVERIENFSLHKIISIEEISKIDFGRYHALVIGNNNYRSLPTLKSSIKDAEKIADLLEKKYDFDVRLQLDATRSDVIKALNYYRKNLTSRDNLLIYYAGHGILDEDTDEGYWLPVDATYESEINWLSNSLITRNIKAISAKHILVVADSCYSGKLLRSIPKRAVKVKSKNNIQHVVKRKIRSVLCSGGLEPVLDGNGKDGHSVFAAAFIDVLSENRDLIDGLDLFHALRPMVKLNSDQTPDYGDIYNAGHDGGDFIFVRNNLIK